MMRIESPVTQRADFFRIYRTELSQQMQSLEMIAVLTDSNVTRMDFVFVDHPLPRI